MIDQEAAKHIIYFIRRYQETEKTRPPTSVLRSCPPKALTQCPRPARSYTKSEANTSFSGWSRESYALVENRHGLARSWFWGPKMFLNSMAGVVAKNYVSHSVSLCNTEYRVYIHIEIFLHMYTYVTTYKSFISCKLYIYISYKL